MNEDTLYVLDQNHRRGSPARVHAVRDGRDNHGGIIIKDYGLTSDTPTEMPYHHGMQFARHAGFLVTTKDGEIITPVAATPEAGVKVALEPGQVIAGLDELTTDALKKRAFGLPDADTLGKRPGRDVLIKWLKEGEAAKQSRVGRGRGSDEVAAMVAGAGDPMSEDQLSKMFPGNEAA